jgi:hypothetical protein
MTYLRFPRLTLTEGIPLSRRQSSSATSKAVGSKSSCTITLHRPPRFTSSLPKASSASATHPALSFEPSSITMAAATLTPPRVTFPPIAAVKLDGS